MTTLTIDQRAQEQALLAAILAEPGEDAHRLIMADWFEEHGQDERAEFIRVQVEADQLALLAEQTDRLDNIGLDWSLLQADKRQRAAVLGNQQLTMLRSNEFWDTLPFPSWAKLYRYTHPPQDHARFFRRGFIHTIHCSLSAWKEYGSAIVSRHPIERVETVEELLVPLEGDGQCGLFQEDIPLWLDNVIDEHGGYVLYPNKAVARMMLSYFLLRWARRQAKTATS